MSTYEERIAALEQTSVSRLDFLNAVNRVMLQQAQNTTETYHEITMLETLLAQVLARLPEKP